MLETQQSDGLPCCISAGGGTGERSAPPAGTSSAPSLPPLIPRPHLTDSPHLHYIASLPLTRNGGSTLVPAPALGSPQMASSEGRGVTYTPSPLPCGRLIRGDAPCFPCVLPSNPMAVPAGTGLAGWEAQGAAGGGTRLARHGSARSCGKHMHGSTGGIGGLGCLGCRRQRREAVR